MPITDKKGGKKLKPFPLEDFCKLRSEIEEEIVERQAMWKRGLSSPPAEKKTEEKKAATPGKPPPTITAG